jgi:hypothetical protein
MDERVDGGDDEQMNEQIVPFLRPASLFDWGCASGRVIEFSL